MRPERWATTCRWWRDSASRTVLAIAAGKYHSCALLDNGDVKCWGDNYYGQLGQGDTTNCGDNSGEMADNLLPVELGSGVTVKAIASNPMASHACVLLEGGAIKCWGYNNDGQIGYGDQENRGDNTDEMGNALFPVNLGTGKTATALSLGALHSCAMLNDGSRKCWGNGGNGKLGYGNMNNVGGNKGEMGDNLPAVLLVDGPTVAPTAAPTAAPTPAPPTAGHAKNNNDDDEDGSVPLGFALALACCSFVLALFLLWRQRKEEEEDKNKSAQAHRAIELVSQQPLENAKRADNNEAVDEKRLVLSGEQVL